MLLNHELRQKFTLKELITKLSIDELKQIYSLKELSEEISIDKLKDFFSKEELNNLEQIGGANNRIGENYKLSNSNMYAEPSKTQLFTIPTGTIIYHGSLNKEAFNPFDIRLGDDRLVSYFSQSKRLAADYIIGCALYPTKSGFLHKFRVKKDISKILIISPHERQSHWTLRFIEDSFCSRKFRIQLDGIGFFFPKKQELGFREGQNAEQRIDFDSEFAICNPNEFLEYISTQRCVSMRKLTPAYSFTGDNNGT